MNGGCTLEGGLLVAPVGGQFRIGLSPTSWGSVLAYTGIDESFKRANNVSHYIHNIEFGGDGKVFPHSHNPFKGMMNSIKHGVGLADFNVKIVPTIYKRPWRKARETYQVSMTENFEQLSTLILSGSQLLPGASFSYDFSPMEVQYTEQRDSLLTFFASTTSVIGGVFVSLTLVSSLTVGAINLAKKAD